VQSRIKMLDKVERLEVPPERKKIHFNFPAAIKSGRMVLELKGVHKAYGGKVVLDGVNLHIERGDRIALVGHNGAGKSTLMRLLVGEEAPDSGTRTEGHQMVMQYFAQDEATRLDPALNIHETMSADSPHTMVPAIRNILGGFLFSGDDIYKKAGVLSGGERTRLAVARMLLRPSNTLLLDEPTNHLDIDSKEVLLDALVDYGGTLIFVSHDRYFVERLATKIIHVGGGKATLYPGSYESFLWSKEQSEAGKAGEAGRAGKEKRPSIPAQPAAPAPPAKTAPAQSFEERKKEQAEKNKRERAFKALKNRVAELEARIAEREKAIKDVEQTMSAPDFYNDHEKSKPVLAQHQALMWEVGELLGQWEMLQSEAEQFADLRNS
jgi:ATP-binding cassette, subfamily F, member 3